MKKLINIVILLSSIGLYVSCDVETIKESSETCDTDGCVSLPPVNSDDLVNQLDPQETTCSGNSYDLCLADFHFGCYKECMSNTNCSEYGCGCMDPVCVMIEEGAPQLRNNGACTADGTYLWMCGGCRIWDDNAGINHTGAWLEVGFQKNSGTCSSGQGYCQGQLHDCKTWDGASGWNRASSEFSGYGDCSGMECDLSCAEYLCKHGWCQLGSQCVSEQDCMDAC